MGLILTANQKLQNTTKTLSYVRPPKSTTKKIYCVDSDRLENDEIAKMTLFRNPVRTKRKGRSKKSGQKT